MAADIVLAHSTAMAAPGGHYSHAVAANGFVFVSGQLPIAPDGRKLADAPFEEQALQVLDNVAAALASAGSSVQRLLQVRVYVTDMNFWPAFDRIYADWIGEHRPARAVAGVASLHFGLLIEIEAVALAMHATGTRPTTENA